jgi:RNA polymerase sigma-70 factor (ECF subfamily)
MSRRSTWSDAEPADGDWAGLLARHARWLRTVLIARSGEPAVVEELFQELTVAVLRKPPVQVADARRPSWLYGVAVRTALMHRRRQGRQRRLVARWEANGGAPTAMPVDPLLWLLATERDQLVQRALQTLSPRDRELLLLKYTEDWSYCDLADHLGLTVSAVEARLHRARGRLRNELVAREVTEAIR